VFIIEKGVCDGDWLGAGMSPNIVGVAMLSRIWKIAIILSNYSVNKFIRKIKICKPPIFIVGSGHSGTSLLLAILGSHSGIYAIPNESKFGYSRRPKAHLKRFNVLAIAAGKQRWVEKTPKHIHCIDKLLELCCDAKILLIIRDGRDVACSIQDRYGNLESGIKRWVASNRAGEAFWSHSNVYVLKYEQIVDDFDSTMRDIMSFLGENYEPEMRQYHQSPRYFFYTNSIERPPNAFGKNHRQYRNWQINQPLFDGKGKWKRMTEEEKFLVKEHANEMLVKYGYATGRDW
jgi:hypothetical protein